MEHDRHVGQLLAKLDELGIASNTSSSLRLRMARRYLRPREMFQSCDFKKDLAIEVLPKLHSGRRPEH
jgi:hypothetical protein